MSSFEDTSFAMLQKMLNPLRGGYVAAISLQSSFGKNQKFFTFTVASVTQYCFPPIHGMSRPMGLPCFEKSHSSGLALHKRKATNSTSNLSR